MILNILLNDVMLIFNFNNVQFRLINGDCTPTATLFLGFHLYKQ